MDSFSKSKGKGVSGNELLPDYDPEKIIRSIKVPIMLITGEDPSHPREWAYKLAKLNKRAVIVDFDSLSPLYGILSFKDTLVNLVDGVLLKRKLKGLVVNLKASDSNVGLKYLYLKRATEAYKSGDLKGYKEYLEKSIRQDGKDLMLYVYLSSYYLTENKPEEAIKILEEGVARCALKSQSLLYAGMIFSQYKRWRDAEKALQTSLLLNNWNSNIYLELSRLYIELGNSEKARYYLRQAKYVNSENQKISEIQSMFGKK